MNQHTIEPEDLDWLGGLALTLVGERHAASDLVQDALATAVQHPEVPREHRRGWYRTVLRRLAASRFRREALRADREAAAARPEAELESAERVDARDLAERLADAVHALDEPYRRTLLLRFHEDLDTAEIAGREGLTADAVRRRVRHGLGLLREELLRRDARGWREWRAALVPLANGSRGARSLAGPGTWALRAAGVALLGGAIAVPLVASSKQKRLAQPAASAPAQWVAGAIPIAGEPGVEASERRTSARVAVPAIGEQGSNSSPGEEFNAAQPELPASGFRGRLLAPDGTPAAGVGVEVFAWPGNQYSPEIHGVVEDWVEPEGVTNNDGRFEFRFDPPPGHWLTIRTDPGAFGRLSWSFSEVDPDSVRDLGTVELHSTGSLRLRPFDASGAPFSGELEFFVDFAKETPGPGGTKPCVRKKYDPSQGELILDGLAEGKHSFRVWSDPLFWVRGGAFEITAGDVTDVEWTLAEASLERSIAVTPRLGLASPWRFFVEQRSRLLREADGARLEPGRLLRRDLEPGTYTFEFEHPWFAAESNTGLETGRRHSVPVRGSADLDLRVLDGPDGEEVQSYSAWLRYLEYPDSSLVLRAEVDDPQQGPFEGIVPTALHVEVDAGELGTGSVEVAELAPGRVSVLVVELEQSTELEVEVLGTLSGAALEGREVVVLPKAHGEPPLWSNWRSAPPARVATNEVGVARATLKRAEPVWVATRIPPGEVVERLVSPVDGEFERVVFEVAETTPVSGFVDCSDSLEGWALELLWSSREPVDPDLDKRRKPYGFAAGSWSQGLSRNGEFGPVELGPGQYRARLTRPRPSPDRYGPQVIELGERSLERGASPAEWSFEASLPARGRVVGKFLLDGQPAAGARLGFRGGPGGSPPPVLLDGAGRLDAEVAPGVYRLNLGIGSILGEGPMLTAWLSGTAAVVEGETVELGADLTTARRGLRLLDADGAPLAGEAPIQIVPADSPPGTGSWTMGGWLAEPYEMWLPLGRYRVERSGEPIAEFDWEAGEGPVEVRTAE